MGDVASRAFQVRPLDFTNACSGILDRPPFAGDDGCGFGAFVLNQSRQIQFSNSNVVCRHDFTISRRDAPELCMHPSPPKEGAGNAGRSMRPKPRVQNKKHTSVVTTGSPGSSRHSLRNGFNGFLRALPGDRAFLPPSLRGYPRNLTPASGRQDHTTSPSADSRHRLWRHPRPPHPAPHW